MRVRDQLVTSRALTSPGTNRRLTITVHETANPSRGAGAAAHANLQSNGNTRRASWHWQVDDTEAVRSFPETVRCWHAGDGAGPGNSDSIGVEICVNADSNYEAALANGADLVSRLRAAYGISASNVVQHNHWTGKNCPAILRSRGGDAWRAFVAATDPGSTPSPSPSPTRTVSAMAGEILAGKHGNGHERRRASLGIDAKTYARVRAEVNRRLR